MLSILIVEDDRQIAELYKTKLDLHNFNVLTAYNGAEALRVVKDKNEKIDLVLLDLSMPIMDGEGFLERFRKLENYTSTPVIILTNLSKSEAPGTLWHHGISGYYIKAHNTPSELLEVVQQTLAIQ